MRCQYVRPPSYLKDYVKCFWILEQGIACLEKAKFGTIADGLPGLIIQLKGSPMFQNGKQLPKMFLYGQTTSCAEILAPTSFYTLGIYFYPHALKSVFGIDAYELTNTFMDADLIREIYQEKLVERLSLSISLNQQMDLISRLLYKGILKNQSYDTCFYDILKQFSFSKGKLSLKELRSELGWSERTLERKFKQHIGVSPKLFARICRFQDTLDVIRTNRSVKLTDLAYEKQYADQSHFNRTFKELTSLTPNQYIKASKEFIANFPQLF